MIRSSSVIAVDCIADFILFLISIDALEKIVVTFYRVYLYVVNQ